MISNPSYNLRRVLLADALTSGAMGVLLLVAAGALEPVLGLPASLLRAAGGILIPFAIFVAAVAVRQPPPRLGVWLIVGLNAIWVVDSVLLPLTHWVAPTGLGLAFILAQALVVLVFAALEFVGVRGATSAVAT